MCRVIFHFDMDAFYAAIEQRDQPRLRGQPVIVGSPPQRRGVVCAASYEARKFGVRSAMPSSVAGRLCPHGVFLPPRIDHYRAESERIMEIVATSGAVVEQVSIDEAYLDCSGQFTGRPEDGAPRDPADAHDRALYAAVPLAQRLKADILARRGLTASIGIAANKLLAKLASDFQKPDGLTLIPERDKVAFLRPLPIQSLHGVGRVTARVLAEAGITTIGDLQDHPGDLRALTGSFGLRLRQFAFGQDDRPLELGDDVKSISSEETFSRDTEDRRTLRACLYAQARDIASRLERKQLAAHTVQVKIRYGDFTTLTRQLSLEEPISEARDLYRLGCFLLARDKLVSRPLRLLGLGASNLTEPGARQLRLF